MTTNQMYDAKLSDITDVPAIWVCDSKGKVTLSFHVRGEVDTRGRHYYTTRVVRSSCYRSRPSSNHSVDVVVLNNKRYLIDSQVELLEGVHQ